MANPPAAALITGAASGIGREVALALAAKGFALTAGQISAATPGCNLVVSKLDVRDEAAQQAAFMQHMRRHGRMDVAVLNAGIGERGEVFDPANKQWQTTLDVDLTAVIAGIKSAVLCMQPSGGTIISVASAGAVFPMPVAPVYAASKAGVVHFTRSAAGGLAEKNIRLMAVCPEFVDTPMVRSVMQRDPKHAKKLLGSLDVQLLQPVQVSDLVLQLLDLRYKGGTILMLRTGGHVVEPFKKQAPSGDKSSSTAAAKAGQPKQPAAAATAGSAPRGALAAWASSNMPASYQKIQVHKLSNNFREATRLVSVPLTAKPPPGHVLVRRVYVGINASDINYTAGRYHGMKAAAAKLPFDCGFESVNITVAVGEGVQGILPGDPLASLTYDGFAEYAVVLAAVALPIPRATPEMVALLTSGLTASIALEQSGQMKARETVLVTAAAGGTGQFAVQLAKLAGCHVIATCGGPQKVQLLRTLGADRVVDYKSEKLQDVLKSEYPKGVDVVYEGVGGDMFDAALNALAMRGRLIIIGMMSQYAEGWKPANYPGITDKLLFKSASLVGFFLLRYASYFRSHLARLVELLDAGRLQVTMDPRRFVGLESVTDAIDYLYTGQSVGKVVVQVAHDLPPPSVSRL